MTALKPARLSVTAAFVLLLAAPLAAQNEPLSLDDIGSDDWGLTCEPQGCIVIKPVLDANDQQIMTLTYAVPNNGGAVRMAILTPLGTALQSGLSLSVGVETQTLSFTTCTPSGCAVMVDLSQPDLSNLLVQPLMELSYQAVNRAEPYNATVQLEGLDEAIEMARNGGQP